MIPEYKIKILDFFKKKLLKKRYELTFIHIPKCGGSYAGQYLDDLKIYNKGHIQASSFDGLTFAIIRDPIKRFESLLNYRLNQTHPRPDWPKHLIEYHYDNEKSLNEIIHKMSDKNIISFKPFRTLNYWIKNVKLLLTIDEFIDALKYLGYTIEKEYETMNVSNKNRGELSHENIERLKNIFKEDYEIYNAWSKK
jgi:hypothetical protein